MPEKISENLQEAQDHLRCASYHLSLLILSALVGIFIPFLKESAYWLYSLMALGIPFTVYYFHAINKHKRALCDERKNKELRINELKTTLRKTYIALVTDARFDNAKASRVLRFFYEPAFLTESESLIISKTQDLEDKLRML
jgi:hypothetical protein